MKYINKKIISTPYYVPLSAHVIKSYTVNVDEDIITANVLSYFNADALNSPDVQPLAMYSVVLNGKPTGDTLDWLLAQLTQEGESVANEYEYQGSYQIISRNTFAGGAVETADGVEDVELLE